MDRVLLDCICMLLSLMLCICSPTAGVLDFAIGSVYCATTFSLKERKCNVSPKTFFILSHYLICCHVLRMHCIMISILSSLRELMHASWVSDLV